MTTYKMIKDFKTSMAFLLILGACLSTGCKETLQVLVGAGNNNLGSTYENEAFEPDFTQTAVQWHVEILGNGFEVLGGTEDVVIIANNTTYSALDLIGYSKSDGTKLWSHRDIANTGTRTPEIFIRGNELLVYSRKAAARLDVNSGAISEEIEIPFYIKSMVFHNDDYYMITDPCDESITAGIYKWNNRDRDDFALTFELQDWAKNRANISQLAITDQHIATPILIIGGTFSINQEFQAEILAYDLEQEEMIWFERRNGEDLGFGYRHGYTIHEDMLYVGRRKALSALSLSTGKMIWEKRFSAEGFYNEQPSFYNGNVYIYDTYLENNFCFSQADGSVRWNYITAVESPIFIQGNQIYWGSADSTPGLARINASSGMQTGTTLAHPWEEDNHISFEFTNSLDARSDMVIISGYKHLAGLRY